MDHKYVFFFSSQYMPMIPLQPTFLVISPTFVVPLILSFLILSSLVTPIIHLNILISATTVTQNPDTLFQFFHPDCILSCIVPLDPQAFSSVTGHTQSPIPSSSFSILINSICVMSASKSPLSANVTQSEPVYIYIIQILCVCVCLSVNYRRPNSWTDHDQIWHIYTDISGNGSNY